MVTSTPTRFVALDVHRKYLVVGAVDAGQKVVLSPRRFGFEAFDAWAPTHLTPSDLVVLEATANAWLLYDQLKPFVADVLVAHPPSGEVDLRRTRENRLARYHKVGKPARCQPHSGDLGSSSSGS